MFAKVVSNGGIRRSVLALALPGAAIPAQAAGITAAAHLANAARVSFAGTAPGGTIGSFIVFGDGQESSPARSEAASVQALNPAAPGVARVGRSRSLGMAANYSVNTSGSPRSGTGQLKMTDVYSSDTSYINQWPIQF